MEQPLNSRTKRAVWTTNSSRIFFGLCIEEKIRGNTPFDWNYIRRHLRKQSGARFEYKQLRNHYDDARYKFKAWEELESWPDLSFDPVTGVPLLVEGDFDRWHAFEKKHGSRVGVFRKKPLVHLDLLRLLFGQPRYMRNFRMSFNEGVGDTNDVGGSSELVVAANNDYESGEESKLTTTISGKRKRIAGSNYSSRSESEASKYRSRNIDDDDDTGTMSYKKVFATLSDIEQVTKRGKAYYLRVAEFLRDDDKRKIFMALPTNNLKFVWVDKNVPYCTAP